jgi:hypothetical protein
MTPNNTDIELYNTTEEADNTSLAIQGESGIMLPPVSEKELKLIKARTDDKYFKLGMQIMGEGRALIRVPHIIAEMPQALLILELGKTITQNILFTGYKTTDIDLEIINRAVRAIISKRYTDLEYPEIVQAFENGVNKDYGDFFGMSAMTFCNFLKQYVETGDHAKYLKSNPKVGELPPHKFEQLPDDEDERKKAATKIMSDSVITCYNEYITSSKIIDLGANKYWWLYNSGIITQTPEEIESYIKYATPILENRLKLGRGVEILKKEANALLALIEKPEWRSVPQLNTIIGNKALEDWFETVKKDGRSLETRFTQYFKNRKINTPTQPTTLTNQLDETNIHPILSPQG